MFINKRSQEMKFTVIVLILIAVSACAPTHDISQVTQVPIEGSATSETTNPQVIVSGTTSALICPCPRGPFLPGPSQGGVIGGTPVICNCPAILITPITPVTDTAPTSQVTSPTIVTLDDNGKTIILHPGDSFLVDLGMDTFNWTVNVDNQDVLSREKNVMVIRGAQGIYQANNPGQAVLTAVGDPLCRSSVPACGAPSILFKITVIVD
jgi:hypothetical protein